MKKTFVSLFSLLLLASLGCSGGEKSSAPKSEAPKGPTVPLTQGIAQSTKGDVVAELNGQPITEQELLTRIKPRLSRIENQLFDIKRDGIDQIIETRLLEEDAKKKNTTVPELLKKEVQDKVGEVTDKEIQEFYDQNKARFGAKTLDELKPQIAAQLKAKKASVYRTNLMDRLMAKADVQIYIERPRVDVGVGSSPAKGTDKASITLIEFTDFQCPFCSRVRPSITELLETYKGDLRYVQRNFPLDFHKDAKKAAVAALCANDQKKYWEYSQKLWDNQRALDPDSLKKYATELKLDTKKFDECLASDKYMAQVTQDMQEGAKAGVTGTPAFFINGQILTGAQPVEAFKKVIDQELRDVKRKKS